MPKNFDLSAGNGGYMFISHAHENIEDVRKLRNIFEENGFEPLCFFLKCLTDDDEIEGLIKREIDARDIFVYVDSPEARKSSWVQKEQAYINSLGTKRIMRTSITDIQRSPEEAAKLMMDSMQVFISYAHVDSKIAKEIALALNENDLKVFYDESIMTGTNYYDEIVSHLSYASEHGCVICIISEASLSSEIIREEIKLASKLHARFIPIVVGSWDVLYQAPPEISHFQGILIDDRPTAKQLRMLIQGVQYILHRKYEESSRD